jgi:hypothetical protein
MFARSGHLDGDLVRRRRRVPIGVRQFSSNLIRQFAVKGGPTQRATTVDPHPPRFGISMTFRLHFISSITTISRTRAPIGSKGCRPCREIVKKSQGKQNHLFFGLIIFYESKLRAYFFKHFSTSNRRRAVSVRSAHQ